MRKGVLILILLLVFSLSACDPYVHERETDEFDFSLLDDCIEQVRLDIGCSLEEGAAYVQKYFIFTSHKMRFLDTKLEAGFRVNGNLIRIFGSIYLMRNVEENSYVNMRNSFLEFQEGIDSITNLTQDTTISYWHEDGYIYKFYRSRGILSTSVDIGTVKMEFLEMFEMYQDDFLEVVEDGYFDIYNFYLINEGPALRVRVDTRFMFYDIEPIEYTFEASVLADYRKTVGDLLEARGYTRFDYY